MVKRMTDEERRLVLRCSNTRCTDDGELYMCGKTAVMWYIAGGVVEPVCRGCADWILTWESIWQ